MAGEVEVAKDVGSGEDCDFYTQKSEPLEDWKGGIAF